MVNIKKSENIINAGKLFYVKYDLCGFLLNTFGGIKND